MLNLEQNGISIMEATISRKQADENARQGKILMAFTIVTVVFVCLDYFTIYLTHSQIDNSSTDAAVVSNITLCLECYGIPT